MWKTRAPRVEKGGFRYTEIPLALSGKTVVHKALALTVVIGTSAMAAEVETSSELSKIAKLNGDFRKNYGTLLGAVLYLRSINAVRGRSWLWAGLFSLVCSAVLGWLGKHGFSLLW
ncbi:hypothetical protein BRDID11002_35820 [Bradyrhizobium diazoefficiens]|uniref:Uncharacterized protein n=2 Tax=Nitrobacteraceae TaxID=41294 RepID=A0A809X980_9BRAD|nr:hypothetical protein XF1B_68170 [Bradyrhizobium diazoefficiens]BCE50392.1 hypothetical protein XF4B_67410 [Bradyrhizobium diazoefficiens]BCF28837.1 hypothetical protein XF14B_67890 [Bradyrhizobium diazoefficiens]